MKEKTKNKKGLTLAAGFPAKFTPGFTLVEALVAVSIVLVGVTAAFGTAQMGLSSTSAVRNRITAIFLAQEALEGVKNIKDSNLQKISLNNSTINWLAGIPAGGASCSQNEACGYDVVDNLLANCGAMDGCKIKTVSENGNIFYRQTAQPGDDTGFIRQIFVEEIVTGKEAKITVQISKQDGRFSPFKVQSLIYNWF